MSQKAAADFSQQIGLPPLSPPKVTELRLLLSTGVPGGVISSIVTRYLKQMTEINMHAEAVSRSVSIYGGRNTLRFGLKENQSFKLLRR